MFEVIVLLIAVLLMATCAFAPLGCNLLFFSKKSPKISPAEKPASPTVASKVKVADHSTSFLAQVQADIEATLFPRPTDSILQRHYDALVAIELRSRLEGLP